ncbi:MAG TPA: PP2C family serine/threonine-protein phosphatase [Pyrinomonadaceae bacterium]|nr:PP2C family serine/threonine-protein phosphatase [Pyrinomonadaceae bacterium]
MENNFRFASASVSDRGLSEKRPVNEDSFIELGQIGLFAVADGVGGAQAGDVASQMAMEILGEAFANLPENLDAEDAMRVAIEHANQAIHNMANELPQLASMATTIVALHVAGNIATIGHVGDSRIYRIEPDGTLHRETADHSVVEEEVRAGRMTPEQALTHPSRNVISRALGAEPTVQVDLKTIMVDPGTMFMLCSDGITRHIGDEELGKLFHNEIEPALLCEHMKELCYKRGAEDNLTAVVVRISTELAGSFAATPVIETPTEAVETEEETVATARSPFDETIQQLEPDEVPAKAEDFKDLVEELDDENYLLDEQAQVLAPVADAEYASSSVVVPARPDPVPEKVIVEKPAFSYADDHGKASGMGGKLLSSILMVLLGAALGVGGYYFWLQANPAPEVPVLNQSKSNNIPLTAFEEARREVDSSPDRYLAANAATPQDAEDHYLLGRAQLLTGKYIEAKRQFGLAKERLGEVDAANKKTLANEIALGLSVVDNPAVAEAFARALQAESQPSNTNSVNGSNSPVR